MGLRKAIKNRRTFGDNRAQKKSAWTARRQSNREARLQKRAERQAKRQEERTKRKGKGSPVLEKLIDGVGSVANTLLGKDGTPLPNNTLDYGKMDLSQPQNEPLINSRMVGDDSLPPKESKGNMMYILLAVVALGFIFRKKLFK